MPKVARSQEDRELIRENILEETLALISENGFASFSMRKLASRLGMTATTIYHYYSNKDELYLMVLTKGFEMLYQRLAKILETTDDPVRKLKEMVRTYIDFGINQSHYYNIMFTADVPKYSDYVGTEIEPVAYIEKQTALKLIDIASLGLEEVIRDTYRIPQDKIRYIVIKLWSTLHGIISLYNSRVLPEVDDHPEQVIAQIAGDILDPVLSSMSTPGTARNASLDKRSSR
jgi:AcrR family transcriptional regulator